jgi:gamma-glutamylcyclotransferase (GGCT)/AIG2-like uncharacterized protein YtfP
MTDRLFVYGTLLAPELRRALLGHPLQGQPGILDGFARYRIKHAVFPAICPAPGQRIVGEVLTAVTAADWLTLDRFESDLYARQVVEISLTDGRLVDADTYVINADARHRLSAQCWDYDEFRRDNLARYVTELAR